MTSAISFAKPVNDKCAASLDDEKSISRRIALHVASLAVNLAFSFLCALHFTLVHLEK